MVKIKGNKIISGILWGVVIHVALTVVLPQLKTLNLNNLFASFNVQAQEPPATTTPPPTEEEPAEEEPMEEGGEEEEYEEEPMEGEDEEEYEDEEPAEANFAYGGRSRIRGAENIMAEYATHIGGV